MSRITRKAVLGEIKRMQANAPAPEFGTGVVKLAYQNGFLRATRMLWGKVTKMQEVQGVGDRITATRSKPLIWPDDLHLRD